MTGVTTPSHAKKHGIDSTKDHKPVSGATNDNVAVFNTDGLPVKDSGVSIHTLTGAMIYQGTWDASTNTPTLSNTDTGVTGHVYRVNVGGTVDFGAGPITFTAGDAVANNGTIWEKWDAADLITSVEGRTGDILLRDDDIYMDGKSILLSNIGTAIAWKDSDSGITPSEGDTYIVGTPAADGFVGQDNKIAIWRSGAWVFITPPMGANYYLSEAVTQKFLTWDGTNWQYLDTRISATLLQNKLDMFNNQITTSKLWAKQEAEEAPRTTVPGSPVTDGYYLVQAGAGGAWAGQDGDMARWTGSTWQFTTPGTHEVYTAKDNQIPYRSTGSAWVPFNKEEILQSNGYHVSNSRGSDTLGNGHEDRPFATIDAAISAGQANGDALIAIFIDGRNAPAYTANIPAGQPVGITEHIGIAGGSSIDITIGDGAILLLNNVYAAIKEAAGISSGTIYAEESIITGIKDNPETGYATNLDGIFSNAIINNTTVYTQITNMNSAVGSVISKKAGAETIYFLNGADLNGHRLRDMGDPSNPQDAATKNYVDVTHSGVTNAHHDKYTDAEARNAVKYQPDVTLAGATPVDSDISSWTVGDRGIGIGTTDRVFLMYAFTGGVVKYTELS